ncbi:uncharacterized protein KY384_004392 [Bacidia gigantensis]|uniref:uncharacterized protein n=1 Tax=Bacidia gigantensis TaxID=2732470 RepID=UPI001D03D31F|nr:uncharacterized protein KY384_004392 [Bacidia gigantensis]KAG8531035.1 hypothetical protein KY384_004392 [Bacidia gigantensis]
MPSDIRSFFGGGGVSSQEKPMPKREEKAKGRPKRKVLSDSDDDVQVQPSKKATPKKVPPKKAVKQESPKGETTTTSDYFAASGKSKPTRSTPSRPKAQPVTQPAKEVNGSFTKPTPKSKSKAGAGDSVNGKVSSRNKGRPQYKEINDEDMSEDDDFKLKILDDADGSGEDMFKADYKPGRRGGKDAYESDDDEKEIFKPSSTKPGSASKAAVSKQTSAIDDDDAKKAKLGKGRKRKSADLEDNENTEVVEPSLKKAKASKAKSPAKSPAKKATPKKKKEEEAAQRTAVDDIFDNIPTVRAPTPPPRDDSKKFDWRTAQARPEPAPSGAPAALPEGAENCLAGLIFVFTGLLDTLDRNAGQELVKRYGGKVTTGPSKKTSFVVLGTDAGPKKLETIKQHGLRTIDENGLFELIRKLPANGGDSKAAEQFEAKKKKEEESVEKAAKEMVQQEREEAKKAAKASNSTKPTSNGGVSASSKTDNQLWTVKYAPSATNMVCGNKGQVEKLQNWLRSWPMNLKTSFRKPGKDGFGIFRAMILHGPPGIGKTTAAHLAAKLEGYDIVESNASDTRSKSLVESGLKGVLDTTSLMGYFAGDGKQVEQGKKKLVLIMDEVDGMSAGDRGGVGAMAATCKKAHIPIILICNDRKLPKMRPFDSVAYDLPFRRPTVDQVRQRMMTICFREHINVPPSVINALIEGSNADIRQVINMLSTAKIDQEAMDFDKGKKMSKSWEKNIILKPWDIVSKILGGGMFASSSKATLNDKIELYFNDHEFSSLMLQENYLGTRPLAAGQYSGREHNLKWLELAEKAASSISDGDLVDRMIHGSQQQWSLMPTHAVFGFVRPASFVAGSQAGSQTRFTTWLGQNSKFGKLSRFIKEIQGHMRLRSSGDRHEIRQQYFSLLWYRLIKELERHGEEAVNPIIDLMDSYFLTKDDRDAMMELGVGPMDQELIKIETQAKSAFTRSYNARTHPLPYMKASQVVAPKKKDKERPDLEEAMDESDSGVESGADKPVGSDDEPLDLKKDKYVKAPTKRKGKKAAPAGGEKGKGKGKGKQVKEEEEDEVDVIVDEDSDVKPKKGRGKGGTGKGKQLKK